MLKYAFTEAESALKSLGSRSGGLSGEEARERLSKYGRNVIEKQKKRGVLWLFFSQFGDVMTLLLVAAAAISGVIAAFSHDLSDLTDTVIIISIIVLNAVVGAVQQYRADKAIEQLKKLSAPTALALRDGVAKRIPAAELTVGDVVLLSEGDLVPADCRILSCAGLKADESALTGESTAAEKCECVIKDAKTPLGGMRNMLFSSTFVVHGNASAVVTGVGRNTQIGEIADMLENQSKGKTPLERSLNKLGKIISAFVIAVAAAVFIFSAAVRGDVLRSFMTSVAIAVAAVPEGLPAVVTIIMALGVQRMSRKNVVIRKLKAIETLGGCTCICTDKTGTLTRNRLEVKHIYPLDEREMLRCMAACNNSVNGSGDPTEVALMAYARSRGCGEEFLRTAENPFSSERKMMSVEVEGGVTYAKGAPDILIKACNYVADNGTFRPITPADRAAVADEVSRLSDSAMRVLGFAKKQGSGEFDMVFLGVAGMADGLKPGVKEAVEECRCAGISAVMITGDHARTALAVAKQAGICYDSSLVYSGEQLDAMPVRARAQAIRRGRVFARVTPAHKNLIVKVKKSAGEVVVMTGDGVNDAPALQSADIGVAMGQSGTDVTKSVADMVIADDCFTTIVSAVREGRRIAANIKKTIAFYLSTNLAEVLAILIATFAFPQYGFLPSTQLLWINLITDTFPVLALGAERGERDAMNRPPERCGAALGRASMLFVLCSGAYICGVTLCAYAFALPAFGNGAATTMAFLTVSFAELFHAFNVRGSRSLFARNAPANPAMLATAAFGVGANVLLCLSPLAPAFGISALAPAQWLTVAALSLSVIVFSELYKLVSAVAKRLVFSRRRAGRTRSSSAA